jgi:hypothetical protein
VTRNGPYRPVVWVLLSQKNGDNQQSLAIAESTGLPYEVKRLEWKASKAQEKALTRAVLEENTESAARRRELGLTAPWPDAVICCGRRAERFAIWIKQQSGGWTKLIKIGRARQSLFAYDLIATPQFPVPDLPNVTTTRFPPTLPVEVTDAGRPTSQLNWSAVQLLKIRKPHRFESRCTTCRKDRAIRREPDETRPFKAAQTKGFDLNSVSLFRRCRLRSGKIVACWDQRDRSCKLPVSGSVEDC